MVLICRLSLVHLGQHLLQETVSGGTSHSAETLDEGASALGEGPAGTKGLGWGRWAGEAVGCVCLGRGGTPRGCQRQVRMHRTPSVLVQKSEVL